MGVFCRLAVRGHHPHEVLGTTPTAVAESERSYLPRKLLVVGCGILFCDLLDPPGYDPTTGHAPGIGAANHRLCAGRRRDRRYGHHHPRPGSHQQSACKGRGSPGTAGAGREGASGAAGCPGRMRLPRVSKRRKRIFSRAWRPKRTICRSLWKTGPSGQKRGWLRWRSAAARCWPPPTSTPAASSGITAPCPPAATPVRWRSFPPPRRRASQRPYSKMILQYARRACQSV